MLGLEDTGKKITRTGKNLVIRQHFFRKQLGSVVVDQLFGVLPIVYVGLFCLCCGMHNFVSFLVYNHPEKEERAGCFAFIVLRMSCFCKCSVALPHGAFGWSAACYYGIS